MSTPTTSSAPWILNGLLETCRDGEEGFRLAAKHIHDKECQSLFNELAAQRQGHASELQALLRSLGEGATESGSIAGAIHRGWMDLKSLFTGGRDQAILAECDRGEEAAADQYREVLEHDEIPPSAREIIAQQLARMVTAQDQLRSLQNRLAGGKG